MKLQRIYIAGPYSQGDVVINVRQAVIAADMLRNAGFTPFVPHLNHLWHTICPRPYEDWLLLDLEWLQACDALLRLPGESPGADREVEKAKMLGIPVFHDLSSLIKADHALYPH